MAFNPILHLVLNQHFSVVTIYEYSTRSPRAYISQVFKQWYLALILPSTDLFLFLFFLKRKNFLLFPQPEIFLSLFIFSVPSIAFGIFSLLHNTSYLFQILVFPFPYCVNVCYRLILHCLTMKCHISSSATPLYTPLFRVVV